MHLRGRRGRRPSARSALLVLAAVAALLVPVLQLSGTASAEGGVPGTLDPSFDPADPAGIALNELVSGVSRVDDSATQPNDGKVLVLADGRVWRFFPDGTLDTSFDQDGVLQPASSDALNPTRIALRPGGGFVLAGAPVGTGCPTGQVAEFDADGNMITGFGVNGVACIDFPGFQGGLISDVAVQDDGQVLVLGIQQAPGGAFHVGLARLSNGNGSQAGATVNTIIQPLHSDFETGEEMAIEADGTVPNGRVVVAGSTNETTDGSLGVVLTRYRGDTLALDTSFGGGDGFNTESIFLDRARRPLRLAVQPDGEGMSVLAAGDNPAGAAGGSRVAAFEQLVFDEDGILADSPADEELTGHSFAVADDLTATDTGYVAAGHFQDSVPSNTTNGLVTIAFGQQFTDPEPLLISHPNVFGLPLSGASGQLLPDGSVLLASVLAGPDGRQLLFNRLVADTSADPPTVALDPDLGTAFGQRGFRVTSGSTRDAAQAVVVQGDRKAVVGGHSGSASGSPAGTVGGPGFVLRHAEDGSLDPTFGDPQRPGAGVSFLDFGVNGVALGPGGRVVAAGARLFDADSEGSTQELGEVQALMGDGSPDKTWNDGRPTSVAPAGNTFPGTFLRDVAVQPGSGGVIVVGDVHTCPGVECTTDNSMLVARLTPEGALDLNFGTRGFTLIGHVQGDDVGLAQGHGVALQPDGTPDGKIVITGSLGNRLVVARLNGDGTRDGSFAAPPAGAPPGPFGDGVLADDLAPGNRPHAAVGRDVAVRGGRIAVAGDLTVTNCSVVVACFATKTAIAVAYTTTGTRDGSFGNNGAVRVLPTASQGSGVAVDDFGNVLVGGTAGSDVLLARLTPQGIPDPTFGTGGVTRTDVHQQTDAGLGLALAPDGKIVLAGLNSDSVGTRVLTARYEPGGVLECTPSPLPFGDVVVGTGALTKTLTCTNTGRSDLRFGPGPVTVSGANAADFTPSAGDCVTLRPLDSCAITVAFKPAAPGDRTATLNIPHTGRGAAGPVQVGLTGKGLARDTTLSFKPNPLTFSEQLGLTTSGPRTVTVTNTGNDNVVINGVSITDNPQGDFAISASKCAPGTSLSPHGGSCQVSVRFTPKAPGTRTAVLRFDDGGAGAPHLLTLRGTGATPTLTVNPGVARLGGVTVATGAKFPPNKTVTLVWADSGSLLAGGFVEPAFSVTSNADGTLTASPLIFRKSRTGARALLATVGAFTANAPFLVAAGSLQPPDFVYRR